MPPQQSADRRGRGASDAIATSSECASGCVTCPTLRDLERRAVPQWPDQCRSWLRSERCVSWVTFDQKQGQKMVLRVDDYGTLKYDDRHASPPAGKGTFASS